MENQVVRRRMNTIMGHFAGNEDSSATHVFPMNCSSTINSVIHRRDNKLFFARQGSSNQACFMKQGSSSVQSRECSSFVNENSSDDSGVPLFSRPAMKESNLQNFVENEPMKQECKLFATEPPKFARPNRGFKGQKQFCPMKIGQTSESYDIEWSPRMDVAEFGCNYVLTIELPGVGTNDIRVEIDNRNLTVMGKRSTQWWRVEGCFKDSISAYHKREILQGPYQVVWPLPIDVNKDRVSAQFVDGFLQITIPKL